MKREKGPRKAADVTVGELYCLSCGRYLGDVEPDVKGLRLLPPPAQTSSTATVVWRKARPYCGRCGGRVVVEPSVGPHRRRASRETPGTVLQRAGFHRRSA